MAGLVRLSTKDSADLAKIHKLGNIGLHIAHLLSFVEENLSKYYLEK